MATLVGGIVTGGTEEFSPSTVNKGKAGDVEPMGDGVPVPVYVPVTAGTVQFG